MMKRIASLMVGFSLMGCSGYETQHSTTALLAVDEGQKVNISTRPYCEVDTVDYELDMHMLALELKDKTKIGFGFNILKGFFKALGLRLNLERGEMLVKMGLSEALRPYQSVVDVTGIGVSKGTEFRFQLDAVQLGLDLGYYYKTPLTELTTKTLKNGLSNVNKELSRVDTPWTTRVVYNLPVEQQVVVPTGSVAGLRLGDQFHIYNVDYLWKGSPCESELLFRRKVPSRPVATAEVTQLEKNAALLTIIDRPMDEPILEGAILEVAKLPLAKKEKKRTLLRSLRFGTVESEKLSIENGKTVDVSIYMRELGAAALSQYGYYPRP